MGIYCPHEHRYGHKLGKKNSDGYGQVISIGTNTFLSLIKKINASDGHFIALQFNVHSKTHETRLRIYFNTTVISLQ